MITAMSSLAPRLLAEATAPKIDTGDTGWLLVSTALVMLMTPALAFFYGGLVRKKNVLSVLMQCFVLLCVISLQWVIFGYSLAFSPDTGSGLIGGLSWSFLHGVGLDPYPDYAATVPHQAFMIFQMMFAVITPALIIGAFAERMKFSAFLIFSLLWATLIYDPSCHWVWGLGGFLRKLGALDFAGGTVVHINAGMAALAAALVLGRRLGYPKIVSPPHSLPFAVLGAALLWFGWFGFNAGSALGSGSLATSAFVATHVAAAAAGLTWAGLEGIFHKRSTMLGMITGAVAGLVAITPAAGFVNLTGALAIGFGASVVCYFAVFYAKQKLGYDDALDAFGVHGIGGIWGALATGLFATKAVNAAGADGLFYGNPAQFIIQLKATVISMVFSFVGTWLLLKLVDKTIGLRVNEHEERIGLDLTQHREAGYTILE
jgi:Amt family ammonium transporter